MKKLFKLLLVLFFCWQIVGFAAAYYALRGNPLLIDNMLTNSELDFEKVTLKANDLTIAASFLPPQNDTAVIILAGIRGNRVAGIPHAEYYHQRGYGVLLIDLRATGESGGKLVTLGYHETAELLAGVEFLQQQNVNHIGAHGMSLGAATIIYSFAEKTDYAFVVLESAYDNIQQAFYNRMPIVSLDNFLLHPLRFWAKQLANIELTQLAPDQLIDRYTGKMLIIAGDSEQKVRPEETQRLYDLAKAEEKQLVWMKNARHVHFFNHYPQEIRQALDDFFIKSGQKCLF